MLIVDPVLLQVDGVFKSEEVPLAPQKPLFTQFTSAAADIASKLPALAAQVVPLLQNGPAERVAASGSTNSGTFLTGVDIDDKPPSASLPTAVSASEPVLVHQSMQHRISCFPNRGIVC